MSTLYLSKNKALGAARLEAYYSGITRYIVKMSIGYYVVVTWEELQRRLTRDELQRCEYTRVEPLIPSSALLY
jgi:hypothetical protein